MPRPDPNTNDASDQEDAEARQIEAQFAGLDNDLVDVEAADGKPEARDETLNAEDEAEARADVSRPAKRG